MKNLIPLMMSLLIIILAPAHTMGAPILVSEPPLEMKLKWDLSNTGMLLVDYDLDKDGKADYHTVRIVTRSNFSKLSLNDMKNNYPEYLIFSVAYSAANYYYIVAKEPILYAIDVDEDGHWDMIYKDPSADGVNGNETLYVVY